MNIQDIPAKVMRERRKMIKKLENKISGTVEMEREREITIKYKKIRFIERVKVDRLLKAAIKDGEVVMI